MSFAPSICILILNYNGQEHLNDCLSSALVAAKNVGRPCPVIVVDNHSTEGDVAYIRKHFPEVEIWEAPSDDYGFSFNDAVRARKEEIVILLTNDMRYDANFIAPLLPYFENPEVFAVTAQVVDWEGKRLITGKSYLERKNFWYYKHWDTSVDKPSYTLYASGGASAFRRSMFLELGGFDTLFRPAYYEEVDLSYRAWKRGWKAIYEPKSLIYHKDAATIGKMHANKEVTRWIYRNHVLFNVKDCGNFSEMLIFLLLLPFRIVRNFFANNRAGAYSMLAALPRIPSALWKRFKCRRQFLVSDSIIMDTINHGKL